MAIMLTDQMGNKLEINSPPQRIISLVPSQTELLFDLGMESEIVGLTRFCIHPNDKVKNISKVGGTKDFKLDRIIALAPDLIIGNKEENEQTGIEELQKHFPVWMSDIKTLEDALNMISKIGELVDKAERAHALARDIRKSFQILESPSRKYSLHTLYLIWKSPYLAAGQETFINDMLVQCGFQNLMPAGSRYPEISEVEIAKLDPDLILLSSEPYPFQEKHIQELKMLAPGAKIILVDGEMFSWYGSRLRHSASYFKEILNTHFDF